MQKFTSTDLRICRSHVVTHLTYTKTSQKNLHVIDLDDATFLSAKFGRQLVPGWKLCPKCTQIINGSVDVDSEDRQKRKPDSDGRTAKALRSLQFAIQESKLNLLQKLVKEKKKAYQKCNSWFRQTGDPGKE